jgi:zinc and cadmium transporter
MKRAASRRAVAVDAWVQTLTAVFAVSAVSLIGAAAGWRLFLRHTVILGLVALAAGALLGDALLHLVPEASELWGGFGLEIGGLMLAGFLLFFVLETALRYGHAHGELAHADPHHHPHTTPAPAGRAQRVAPFGWMNLAGDGLHNLIDGVVIAAAFSHSVELGLGTTLAVALHEIPQELGDFAVLVKAGFSRRRALFYNFASGLLAMAGALTFLLVPFDPETLERYALPVTAGGFLYIAAADLIPELHHHAGERRVSALALGGLLAGLAAMAGLLLLE